MIMMIIMTKTTANFRKNLRKSNERFWNRSETQDLVRIASVRGLPVLHCLVGDACWFLVLFAAGDILNTNTHRWRLAVGFLQQCCGDECLVLLQRARQDPRRRVSVSNHVCEGVIPPFVRELSLFNCLPVTKKANPSTQVAPAFVH